MSRTLRELAKPVRDEDLPHLAKYIARGTRWLSAVVGVIVALSTMVDVLRGVTVAWRAAVAVSVFGAVSATCVAVLRCPDAHRRAPRVLFAFTVAFLLSLVSDAWSQGSGVSETLCVGAVAPIALAAFVPWRPVYSLALGGAVIAVVLGAEAVGIRQIMPIPALVITCVCFAVTGAIASHVQRRFWLELERVRAELVASERMSTLGKLTAGVAHELKTPLAAALNGLQSMRCLASELDESIGHPQITEDDLREIAHELATSTTGVEAALERATRFIGAIRSQTREMHVVDAVDFSVSDVVEDAVTLLAHAARRAHVKVGTGAVDRQVRLHGDPGKLGQIVTNLIGNAIDACADGKGKSVTVAAEVRDEVVVLTVSDDGPGIPPALGERVFEPLVSTKTNSGTGLGLSISRDIASGAFGGTLRLVPAARGACFEVRIPLAVREKRQRAAWVPDGPAATAAAAEPAA